MHLIKTGDKERLQQFLCNWEAFDLLYVEIFSDALLKYWREVRQFKGFGYYLYYRKTRCPQIYIKLTPFEDNDGRRHPLKYYLMRCLVAQKVAKHRKLLLCKKKRFQSKILAFIFAVSGTPLISCLAKTC